MCRGGRLLADFSAGTFKRPDVPEAVAESLTITVDGLWVIWGRKVAVRVSDSYRPLTNRGTYPADAIATCGLRFDHDAPDPECTCGFHALSGDWSGFPLDAPTRLDVVFTGRVLAFEYADRVLFRAARQTVVHATDVGPQPGWFIPPDPTGRLAPLQDAAPRGSGPVRLRLPAEVVAIDDDTGDDYATLTLGRATVAG